MVRSASGKKRTVAAVLVVLVLLGYPFAKLQWAKARVGKLCREVHVGMPVAEARRLANASGLIVMDGKGSPGTGEQDILTWEGWAFARHFCDINHDGSRVTKVDRYFMD